MKWLGAKVALFCRIQFFWFKPSHQEGEGDHYLIFTPMGQHHFPQPQEGTSQITKKSSVIDRFINCT